MAGARGGAQEALLNGARDDERRARLRARFRGCLLGGALGDALGAPLEFLDLGNIRSRFGPGGLEAPAPAYGRLGAVTDDTQMTLFTAEGLIRAQVRRAQRGICHPPSVVWHAYLRWLATQGDSWREIGGRFYSDDNREPDGWLVGERWLHARRAPGSTCLAALRSHRMGEVRHPLNDSKGCGGVMRVAPAGLVDGPNGGDRFRGDDVDFGGIFTLGCELAAITHGHGSGYCAAGALAVTIQALVRGQRLAAALDTAERELREHHEAAETLAALAAARALADEPPSLERLESLGRGWVAEEALAMAVYAALAHADDPRAALRLAINHSGDSDSVGALCGSLLGALHGEGALPVEWLEALEGRATIERLADDLCATMTGAMPAVAAPEPDEAARAWERRYPGW
ncbi:MAG: ADP-ribosylglycohydrolase family protein [Thermoanaerobaculia bacterium]|nr:ADP-ribosylglycohydrolase family protein [Thermoanaerobaculia bacterium]